MRWATTMVWAVLAVACGAERSAVERLRFAPREALSGVGTDGFERALAPREFVFPADHGPHPAFRTEWWYATGNLAGAGGRRFGFQLTIFRNALAADPPATASAWRTRDLWFAHFAITDGAGGEMHGFERFARGALGLAGARAEPFRAWLEDWEIVSVAEDLLPLRIRARQDGVELELRLDSKKPIVLQGDRGLSRKSAEPGNASYYYSLTRLEGGGVVVLDGEQHAVEGTAWLDREWSTSALGRDQVGWDWFALQLDDGRELMLYVLRRGDGSSDSSSSGTLVAADGTASRLGLDDFLIEVTDTWTNPEGSVYPSGWRIRVPRDGLDLTVAPDVADQEHDFVVRYWEGAVDVQGAAGERGFGYVELTGYSH